MTKGTVSQLVDSGASIPDKVAGLLDFGYDRFQIAKMLDLTLNRVHKIMAENNLKQLSERGDKA